MTKTWLIDVAFEGIMEVEIEAETEEDACRLAEDEAFSELGEVVEMDIVRGTATVCMRPEEYPDWEE